MAELAPIQRFYQAGVIVINFCPAIANINAPTRVELTAGTTFQKHVMAINGFGVESEELPTKDYGSRYVSKIEGDTSSPDSSLTIYAAKDGVDARSLFTRGTNGFLAFSDGGDVTGSFMDVYPVRVRAAPKQRSNSEPFVIMYQFSITSEPAEDVAIPATA